MTLLAEAMTIHAFTLREAVLVALDSRGLVVQRGDWLAQHDAPAAKVNIGLVSGGIPVASLQLSTVGSRGHPSTWADAAWEWQAEAILRWVFGPRGEA